MIIHNRTSDTNRPQSRSTGHACIVPFNYAGQMNAIVKVLPRLPSELNMWQVVVTDKHKEFKMPINVEKIRVALDWHTNTIACSKNCQREMVIMKRAGGACRFSRISRASHLVICAPRRWTISHKSSIQSCSLGHLMSTLSILVLPNLEYWILFLFFLTHMVVFKI